MLLVPSLDLLKPASRTTSLWENGRCAAWLCGSTEKRTGPSCISVIGWCPSRRCGVAVRPTTYRAFASASTRSNETAGRWWHSSTMTCRQLADALDELVPTGRRVARLPGLLALEPCRENVLAPAKERPEQLHLLGGGPWDRSRDREGKVHANLPLGAQGRQLSMERGKARSGITLLAIQPCEQSLLLGDGLQQRLAAYPLTGALLPVASRLLSLVLHRAS